MNRRIFLVGMPGSGKSTVGAVLANALHAPFFDLDKEIELSANDIIANIFEQQGEGAFRIVEAEALQRLIAEHPEGVIATGGGAPVYSNGMHIMNDHGVTVFLDVSIKTLLNRIKENKDRPLLVKDAETQLIHLEKARRPTYLKASCYIDCDHLSPNEIAQQIMNKLK